MCYTAITDPGLPADCNQGAFEALKPACHVVAAKCMIIVAVV